MSREKILLSSRDRTQTGQRLFFIGRFANLLNRREQQSDQNSDNRNHHDQLKQREPILFLLIAQNIPLSIRHDFLPS